MTFTPTEEQRSIIAAATDTEDNLLISAYAGAAKTATLVLVAEALPANKEILCLAFNKKIATEMNERLPTHCKAMTLNSLGHRTWSAAIGKRLRINAKKTYGLMQAVLEEQAKPDKDALYKRMADLMRIVDFGKACGYVPTDTYSNAKPLMSDEDFFPHLEDKLTKLEESVVREVTLRSIKLALSGECDFNDQLFMPTIFHGAFPRYYLTLIDEAQDLSALNHAMIRKMVKTRRVIAVGDQCQAIYGFRGAHEDGMAKLRQEFSMKEMKLTVSFRCPKAVVEACKWRAPDMKSPEWAKEGSVDHLTEWRADDIPEDAAIICRNNAPLFALAIKLLKNGRPAELDGKDVVNQITKVMSKFGSHDMPQMQVLDCVGAWEHAEMQKYRPSAHQRIRDRADCMRVFAEDQPDLAAALTYARHIAQIHSPLKLMTGHKSKGLEFNCVFFLDDHLISDEKQDPNIRYVIMSRAMEQLVYARSEEFLDATDKQSFAATA